MEFDDLKIGGGKGEKKENHEKPEADSADYFVSDAQVGGDILEQVKSFKEADEDQVIYGVYNSEGKPFLKKINDFLIDHSGITLKDKSYFFHMLAVMVDAGIPVVKAVKSLASRGKNHRFRRILNTIAYNCEGGSKLSDAMSRFEDVFDESELGIIRSGEATGRLHLMLFKLSAQMDSRHDLYMKLWGAAIYPIAVLAVLILVATGMLVWIFPTLLTLLEESGIGGSELPFATRFLMGIHSVIVGYWWVILIVLFGFYGMFIMYARSSYGAVRWDYMKLKMPIVGGLLRKISVLKFITMLGILIEAGLPVIRALKITGNGISNRVYKLKVQEVIDEVKAGSKISKSLEDSEYLFPAEVVQMLCVGEESASLDKVSEKISGQYQREIENSLKKLTSVFEPVMILIVGVFVALLALAIMAPIFNLSSSIG